MDRHCVSRGRGAGRSGPLRYPARPGDRNAVYTPQVLEPITYRQGKLDALHRRCGAGPQLAMGDSLSDASLLHAAQVGILVDRGDPALRDHAHEVGWHIVEGW